MSDSGSYLPKLSNSDLSNISDLTAQHNMKFGSQRWQKMRFFLSDST